MILPFCCLLMLLLLALGTAVGGLLVWRALVKRRLKKKYGIGQDDVSMVDMQQQQEGGAEEM